MWRFQEFHWEFQFFQLKNWKNVGKTLENWKSADVSSGTAGQRTCLGAACRDGTGCLCPMSRCGGIQVISHSAVCLCGVTGDRNPVPCGKPPETGSQSPVPPNTPTVSPAAVLGSAERGQCRGRAKKISPGGRWGLRGAEVCGWAGCYPFLVPRM